MIKKEITDKVNQLRYNLCENKMSNDCFRSLHSLRSLQQSLIFFRINYPTCQSIILIPQFDGINMYQPCIKIISV